MPQHYSPELRAIQGGRYEIIGKVGTGGSAVVYKARDTFLDKPVAIKILVRSASETEKLRFQREAQIIGSLKHANILGVLDFGLTEDGEPYLVLDFVEGETLFHRLLTRGVPTLDESFPILVQAARGLAHAHAKDIVHRDIKPSNLMLVRNSEGEIAVKILDFGLAKSLVSEHDLTAPGVAPGTFVYMAPEQIQGQETDTRTDIYSFGCMAFELLTGFAPFEADSAVELFNLHLRQAPPSALEHSSLEIPRELDLIIQRCMSKKPDDRYSDAQELSVALENCWKSWQILCAEEEARRRTVSDTVSDRSAEDRPAKMSKRHLLWIAGALILLTVLCAVSFSLLRPQQQKEVSDRGADKFLVKPGKEKQHYYVAVGASDGDLKSFLAYHTPWKLDLTNSTVTIEGLQALSKSAIKDLIIDERPVSADELQAISKITNLQGLECRKSEAGNVSDGTDGHTNRIDLSGLRYLENLSDLKSLEVECVTLNDDAFESFARMKSLQCLGIKGDTGCGGRRYKLLRNLKHLQIIDAAETDVSDDFFEDMPDDVQLREVNLDLTGVSDKTVRKVAAIKTLQRITLNMAENVSDSTIMWLKRKRPDLIVERDR